MFHYILRRLILLPITLFCIILVNFVIVNLAPGDPVTISEVSQQGATKQESSSVAFGSDDRYLQFREFYGLTLPILFNTWPFTSEQTVRTNLWQLAYRKISPESPTEMSAKEFDNLRLSFGDRSRFIMPLLIKVAEDEQEDLAIRRMAVRFFVRGGTRQAFLGPDLTETQREYNRKIGQDNSFLLNQLVNPSDTETKLDEHVRSLRAWYEKNRDYYNFAPSANQKLGMFFVETRFFRYMSRVLRLDFGTMRNDPNKTVVSEVAKRFKYSLTLSVIPMLLTFFLCQLFGVTMALYRNRWPDLTLNLVFLVLYAIQVFIVAPFLIENVALNRTFPFTDIPIPISGFTSPESTYARETSWQRFTDVLQHLLLPLIAIMYGTLAAQTRLSRTAILEVLHQDYVRTARAKGLPREKILVKHVGRNAAITVVTSIAGSLGIVLGGSLIVETLFEIDGFGRFFYEAVLNRDYNVIMFSALAGSFLTLIGYLVADIAYTMLDPRVTLD
jgi:peptide/nickel transport system permease protein